MMNRIGRVFRVGLLAGVCLLLASCEPPAVYGSIGYSSYGGGYGHGGMGGSVSMGGRIF